MFFPNSEADICRLAEALRLNALLRKRYKKQPLVLAYHGVVPDELLASPLVYGNSVGVTEFSRQMAVLSELFEPVTSSQLCDWCTSAINLPDNAVLVTFDDGLQNNLIFAAPVLRRFGIPALINIATGYIGGDRVLWPDEVYARVLFWPERELPLPGSMQKFFMPEEFRERRAVAGCIRELCKTLVQDDLTSYLVLLRRCELDEIPPEIGRFLTWTEVGKLHDLGFEIGSHTVEHPILTRLDPRSVASELLDSKRAIERRLGVMCKCFAYPNGGTDDVSPRLVQNVREAGFMSAFTLTGCRASPGSDPLMLDRVYVPGSVPLTDFHSRISGFREIARRFHRVVRTKNATYGLSFSRKNDSSPTGANPTGTAAIANDVV